MIIATQSFGLKKEFEADVPGTIRRLHDMGFHGIEPFILFQKEQGKMARNTWAQDTLKTAWRTMQELGMVIPSAHIGVGFEWATMPAGRVIQNILSLHEEYGIDSFVLSAPFGSAPLAMRWAKLAKKVSNAVKPHGCRIIYHNHDDEFHSVRGGGTAMDVFLKNAGEDVLLQIDIGWAGMAGDERELVSRYSGRMYSLHLKDFYAQYRGGYTRKNMPDAAFAPIGEGAIYTKEIIQRVKSMPRFSGALIIDQDKSNGDMMDALKIGLENIAGMLEEIEAK